ncbi:hypothetical protein EJB05_38633, partial [Eragrostis curvula]
MRGVVCGLPAYLRGRHRQRQASVFVFFRNRHDLQMCPRRGTGTCASASYARWCSVRLLNLMAADPAAYFCGIDISLGEMSAIEEEGDKVTLFSEANIPNFSTPNFLIASLLSEYVRIYWHILIEAGLLLWITRQSLLHVWSRG